MRKIIAATLAVVVLVAAGALAGDTGSMGHGKAKAESGGEHKTFDGKLVCLGCSLKQAAGARANCRLFGHSHAVKLADGKHVILLENEYSKDLLAGEKYHDKDVSVHGIYFASANVIDVETFTADGKKHSWCDGCKAMDQCAMK